MFQLGELMSLMRREGERAIRKFHKPPRIGFVSSYDPKEHKAKVTFQPTGAQSGWIPISALAVGNMFGHLSAPKIGDQVRVEFQEGEHDAGRLTTRLFNKPNPPPQIQAGEYAKIHETGSGHYHKQDGTVQYAGPQFFKVGQDQPGQSGQTQTGGQNGSQQNQQQQQQQQNQNAGKQCYQLNPDGSVTHKIPDPNAQGEGTPQNPRYDATVQNDITHTSTEGSIEHSAQQGSITHTAQAISNSSATTYSRSAKKQIADSAPLIAHNGPTTVSSTLGVSQVTTALAYNQSSDRRLKANFGEFSGVLERATQIQTWRFDVHPVIHGEGFFITEWDKPRRSFGVIAQEIKELFPEIVSGNEDSGGLLQLEEGKIGVIALRALQEYVAKTDAKIAQLEDRINELEKDANG